ncbi:hypothetical protein [Streptomyces arboris]|uniref:hypothetical protein n=1 Tax=Streptomyces arboris TaxID=2600619 RepID=UPI003BF60AB0
MTTQPEPVHHLLDRLLRGVILPAEGEQLAALVQELEQRADDAERMARTLAPQVEQLTSTYVELETEVARLTAGQCTHARSMCEQYHATPVAGCPYPRCRAATATGSAPTA